MSRWDAERQYRRNEVITFRKTTEPFGGLSNMAPGFPLIISAHNIRTSEALYQCCRYPHMPDVQREIVLQNSPMTAKMVAKRYRPETRPDWDAVRVQVMAWCLKVKLAQNWRSFGDLLLRTDRKVIVEESRKDTFWGAKLVDLNTLVGVNILGRLLMKLRARYVNGGIDEFRAVPPLVIPNFTLFGGPIETVLIDQRYVMQKQSAIHQNSLDLHNEY